MKQLGRDMKRARREQGMTQNDLAAQMQLLGMDVSCDRVRKLESGALRMSIDELFVLSSLLAWDLNYRAGAYIRAMAV